MTEKKLSELIYEVQFKSIKNGLFGGEKVYAAQSVNFFLENAASSAEKLEKENEELKERLREMEEKMEQTKPVESVHSEENVQSNQENDILERFEMETDLDENLRRRKRQIETIEKSTREILILAEEQADRIRETAKEEAKKYYVQSEQKAELLIKEANARCEQKRNEYDELKQKADEVEKSLLKMADAIYQNYNSEKDVVS